MAIVNSIFSWLMKKRVHQIELFMKYPEDIQQEVFGSLIGVAQNTEWGKLYGYSSINSYDDFKNRVPVQSYESLQPYIDRMISGEKNILWHSDVRWFAKSSGTTSHKSKFIPVSEESLENCHFKGGKDLLALYSNNFPETNLLLGKGLALGGSHQVNQLSPESYYGDLSAVIIRNLPFWAEFMRTPDISIALLENYEEKIEKMARATLDVNVTSIAGIPTWTLVLARKVLDITGKSSLKEVWPDLELYTHGAVSFTPYKEQFEQIMPSVNFVETYNASEGFFGIQDQADSDEMLLMLDYDIFYEFIPMEYFSSENPPTVSIADVQIGKNYAMLITTNGGLWRYLIGDTIKFTSLAPHRFKITGRTKHFINAFGEELIIDNVENALAIACQNTGARITDYTACPIYFTGNDVGAHEWLIEFEHEPNSIEFFTDILDKALMDINSDYEAKRSSGLTLKRPIVHSLPSQTFYNWMKGRQKLGGQHKVPRLSNDRLYVDDILARVSV